VINQYLNRIQTKIRKVIGRDWVGKLDAIESKINRDEHKIPRKNIRVLMGPSFAIWAPSYALDRSLSLALRLRGVDVIPMYCDSIQHVECNYVGGDSGGKENFSKNCKSCKNTSEKLWQFNPNKSLPFSKYVSPLDVAHIVSEVSGLGFDEALSYTKFGITYGAMAKDIMVNNYLVATPTLIENHEYLLKLHLENLLLVSLAYERILDEQKPDRVVSNDSYYGMWAVLEQHCKARSIPFYSHWPVTKTRAAFAYNDAAMNLDFTKSWDSFSKIDLTKDDESRISKWLNGERGLIIDTTKLAGHEVNEPILDIIDTQKPTIVLAANVIWDLAALNKQIVFKGMIEWIVETIDWFRNNNQFQLIIRPHPAETSPQIPRTRETVAAAIELNNIKLPGNVFLLKSDAKVTLKDLIAKCNVRGITVHTTTVGFEYAAGGLSVITTAKSPYRGFGFTIDPVTKDEYFMQINKLLSGDLTLVSDSNKTLAKKFIKFYQFHYYLDIGLFAGNPPRLALNYLELLEKEDSSFGYVVNSIIEGIPINAENRWLPES
jgi:hypothetical protein